MKSISQKINKIEDEIYKLIKKNILVVVFGIITILSLWVRFKFIGFMSEDSKIFISGWFDELAQQGGILALGKEIGNYNIPYLFIMSLLLYLPFNPLYSLKVVSIVFDYIMAFASMMVVYELLKNNPKKHLYGLVTYVIVVCLPTVLLNSSCWGQCDSIYVTFILFSILYLLKEKHIISFIFLGIAFAFKLQTIFILPVFILIYVSQRKFSILNFLIIPIVNIILNLPAMLMGRSFMSCMNIYKEQINSYKEYISMNISNVYTLFIKTNETYNVAPNIQENLGQIGIMVTIAIYVIIALLIIYNKAKINKESIILLSVWSVMIATFFLPKMHDRYMYIAEVMSIIYFIINRKKFYIPIAIHLASLYTYIIYLFNSNAFSSEAVALVNLGVVILLTYEVIKKVTTVEKQDEIKPVSN